jgi:hypothetical protein
VLLRPVFLTLKPLVPTPIGCCYPTGVFVRHRFFRGTPDPAGVLIYYEIFLRGTPDPAGVLVSHQAFCIPPGISYPTGDLVSHRGFCIPPVISYSTRCFCFRWVRVTSDGASSERAKKLPVPRIDKRKRMQYTRRKLLRQSCSLTTACASDSQERMLVAHRQPRPRHSRSGCSMNRFCLTCIYLRHGLGTRLTTVSLPDVRVCFGVRIGDKVTCTVR